MRQVVAGAPGFQRQGLLARGLAMPLLGLDARRGALSDERARMAPLPLQLPFGGQKHLRGARVRNRYKLAPPGLAKITYLTFRFVQVLAH